MATIDELAVQIAAINRASAEIRKVAADIQRLDQVAGKTGGIAAMNAQHATLGRFMQATGLQSTALGSQITSLNAGIGAMGVATAGAAVGIGALAAGLAASAKAAIDFEESFAGIKKTADLTEQEFTALAAANRKLALELPISVGEINRIGAIAGQLGIQGVEGIRSFEKEIASLGITTGLSADQLATSLGQVTAIFGIQAKDISRVGSALTDLGNKYNGTELQILDFTSRIAGSAKTMRLSVIDTIAIANAFTHAGIEAERGGTAVQKILFEINNAAVTSNKSLAVFAALTGTTTEAFRELVKADPMAAFIRFIEGLKKAGDEAVPVLEALGIADARLVASALSVANITGLVADSRRDGTKAALENVATEIEVAKRMDTTSAQAQLLNNRMHDYAITLGDELNPALRESITLMNWSLDATEAAIRKFGELPDPIKDVIAVVALLPTVTGTAALAAAQLAEDWRGSWNTIATSTEIAANVIVAAANAAIGAINAVISAVNQGAGYLDRLLPGDAIKDIPSVPTIPQVPIGTLLPRADVSGGVGGAVAGGLDASVKSIFDFAKRAQDAADATSDWTLDIDALLRELAALNGGGGGGGGGGAISAAARDVNALADAFREWQQANPGGSIEGFVATMELAQEGLLDAANAAGKTAEEAFRARVDLTKLAIVLDKAGISAQQFINQRFFTAIAANFQEAQVDMNTSILALVSGMQDFSVSAIQAAAALLAAGEAMAKATGKAINSVGAENITLPDGTRISVRGNLTDSGLEKIIDRIVREHPGVPRGDIEDPIRRGTSRNEPPPRDPRVPERRGNAGTTIVSNGPIHINAKANVAEVLSDLAKHIR